MAIDPKLPIPVYFQLKTLLLEEILEGRYGPDGRLPTEHQLCERHGISRTQWAYETDGRGRARRYHDANDLPTALAPLWGLCPPDDRHWTATMRFALDPANPGWSPGRWGGLGSAHTPGTWPLGDVQEWVAASLLGDPGRAGRALERLLAVAAPDGLLPETYDSGTGRWLARPWFAWPSATLAALALGAWNTGLNGASAG